jgi:hypothetical protein
MGDGVQVAGWGLRVLQFWILDFGFSIKKWIPGEPDCFLRQAGPDNGRMS